MATYVTKALWRAKVHARARELQTAAKRAATDQGITFDNDGNPVGGPANLIYLYQDVRQHAEDAEECINAPWTLLGWLRGSAIEAAWSSIHEGDVELIGLLPNELLLGKLPEISSTVEAYMPETDLRRKNLEKLVREPPQALGPQHRELISTTLRGAYLDSDTDHGRVRSFRNILLGSAVAIGVLLIGLGFVGVAWRTAIPLCVTNAAQVACPTGSGANGGDVFLVELMGLVGAALAGVLSLSGSQHVATPYSLVVTQAMLKATAGAATAVIGVVFFSASIVPGLGQVPSQAVILTYAVLFGYAQQLFTRVIDQKAKAVLQAASPTSPA